MSDYREYPRMLYRDGETCLVTDEMSLAVALVDGWVKYLTVPVVDTAPQDAAAGDAPPANEGMMAAPAKRKPGRPKKTEEA